jgi:hypothetical protein
MISHRSFIRLVALAAISLLVLALAACASPPVQAMSNARQAVHAANRVGAPHYAPRIYAEAKRWLNDAEYALKIKDYGRARKSALHAQRAARAANLAAREAHSTAPPSGSGP